MIGISRRSFLAGAAGISTLGALPAPARSDPPADSIVLENDQVRAVFDRKYGSLLTLENKQTGWRVQDRVQFGAGFRMHVPLPERRTNFVTEKENPLQSAEMHPGTAASLSSGATSPVLTPALWTLLCVRAYR